MYFFWAECVSRILFSPRAVQGRWIPEHIILCCILMQVVINIIYTIYAYIQLGITNESETHFHYIYTIASIIYKIHASTLLRTHIYLPGQTLEIFSRLSPCPCGDIRVYRQVHILYIIIRYAYQHFAIFFFFCEHNTYIVTVTRILCNIQRLVFIFFTISKCIIRKLLLIFSIVIHIFLYS